MSRCSHASLRRAGVLLTAVVCAAVLASIAPTMAAAGLGTHLLESRALDYDAPNARTTSFAGQRAGVTASRPHFVRSKQSGPQILLSRAAKAGTASLDDLARAAQASERGGQTAAGRALQKHGDRAGSIYPRIGSPAERSRVAQEIVEDYLTNPSVRERVRRDGVRIFEMADGRGVSFNRNGSFRGLLEPYR